MVNGTDTVKVVVVGPSWMAAGAAATGALFQRASKALGSTELWVLIPHRDRVIVFKEDEVEAASEALASGILTAEADGAKPMSTKQFALDSCGVAPAGRRALEWLLLSTGKGATRGEIEASLPSGSKWKWTDEEGGRPAKLSGHHWRAPPFGIHFEFAEGLLRAARVVGLSVGDFPVLEDLDKKLRQSFPSVAFTTSLGAWDLQSVRKIIEGKGNEKVKMATPIRASVPGLGDLSGQVFGCRVDGKQAYGFDLGWFPGGLWFLTRHEAS